MSHSVHPLFVISTFPDAEIARHITRVLVEERLAACGNIVPGVESIYRWKEVVETASEVIVLYKTTDDICPALQARLQTLHPYEVPEIVALPVAGGLASYLEWVAANVRQVGA